MKPDLSSTIELDDCFIGIPVGLRCDGSDLAVCSVLCVFRELCAVLWMMHTRDNLSLALRQKQKMADMKVMYRLRE